jgi:branched-chain amino acid aminotransferase
MQFPKGIVDVDGVQHRPEAARVSVFDRGFLYGDSAFEALRTYGGRGFRQRAHLERLARSCERLRIGLPLSIEALHERVESAVKATGLPECYLRIVVTRGVGVMGLDLGLGLSPSVVVYALEIKEQPAEMYERGIGVGLQHTYRSADGTPAAGAKTSNYLASMLALDAVKARGASEVLIVDAAGAILEGGTSNVFLVQGGALITPPLSVGILEGITRRTVLQLAAELGIGCEERTIMPLDLARADEAFITSSIREVVPVVKADDVVVGKGVPGAVTLRLLEAYRAETRRGRG